MRGEGPASSSRTWTSGPPEPCGLNCPFPVARPRTRQRRFTVHARVHVQTRSSVPLVQCPRVQCPRVQCPRCPIAALGSDLKLRRGTPPASSLFRVVLAIQGPSRSHVNFGMGFSVSVESATGICGEGVPHAICTSLPWTVPSATASSSASAGVPLLWRSWACPGPESGRLPPQSSHPLPPR